MLWRLKMLGIETMGEIARLPLGAFQQQFGPEGKRCWELASGIDNEPLVPRVTESTIVRRMQLPAPAVALETILAGFERLLFAAYSDRARQGHWVRKVVVRGLQDGGGAWELPISFREAMADPKAAWFAVRNAITRHPPERPLEELEIELCGLSGESGKQAPMFESKGKLWRQVEEAARHLEHERKTVDRENSGGGTVVADTRAASGARRLRQLNQPRRSASKPDADGVPSRLSNAAPSKPSSKPGGIEDEWWRAQPISRVYWRLLLEDGRTIDVYRDSVRDRWYRQAYSG